MPIVKNYVDHQRDVIVRRTKHELREREARLHILEGLLKAINVIDEIINVTDRIQAQHRSRRAEALANSREHGLRRDLPVRRLHADHQGSVIAAITCLMSRK